MASPNKGEASETEQNADLDTELANLNPTITYRHLLSQVPNVKNPLRVVALCDMNAFYAACERVRLNLDPSIPLAVQQWEALIAVNYPAREFGIKRMDKAKDALAKCPHLKVVHTATYAEGETEPVYRENPDYAKYKISLDYYRSESAKIANMLKETVTSGEVEKASVDECFIDFTQAIKEEILLRYPEFSQPPKDSPLGLDTPLPPPPAIPLEESGSVIPITPTPEKKEGAEGEDSSRDPVEPGALNDDFITKTWHDVALSISGKLMQRCRDRINNELGYPNTAGLARNKFLAKLAANFKKRDNQSILRNTAIPNYLRNFPFQKIRNFGGKLGKTLAMEYEVATVGDLLPVSLDDLRTKFGDGALWIYGILRGVDLSEVKEKGHVKSMASSKNMAKPIMKYHEAHHWLLLMSGELSHRLINARAESHGLWPKTLSLFASKGWKSSRRKQAPFPFSRDINPNVICAIADKLWKELVGGVKEPYQFTHLGIAFHGIEVVAAGQQHINGFFRASTPGQEKPKSLSRKRKRSISEAPLSKPKESSSAVECTGNMFSSNTGDANLGSWKCPKCGTEIMVDPNFDINDQLEQLTKLRMIHEDGHFAESLSASLNASSQLPSPSTSTIRSPLRPANKSHNPVKKKRRKQDDLLNFFERQ